MPTVPHNYTYTLTAVQGGGNTVSLNWTEQTFADISVNLSESIPGGSTNLEVTYAISFANLKTFLMWADRDMTVKTNSSSVPDDTFALQAGQPVHYHLNGQLPGVAPITADITSLFVTLSAGAASVLHINATSNA